MGSETGLQQQERQARGAHLAWMLAVAYLLVIAYASLQPFRGWWVPPEEIRFFLKAPWPRYITLEDVAVNVLAYVPLGFLLAQGLMARRTAARAVFFAALLACLMSLAMEAAQMFMSTRIASKVDVLTNGIGGLIGALAAPLTSPTRAPGLKLARLRDAWFVPGPSTDAGLVLLMLWIMTQLHPTAQIFGTGNLRHTFDLPGWFMHTPQLQLTAQAAVAGLNMLGLGLLVFALTREVPGRAVVLAATLGAGIAVKLSAGFAIAKTPAPLVWLTPGVMLGMLLAAPVLYGLAQLPRRAHWVFAALCFTAAIGVVNVAPDNPYQIVPPQLLTGPTHYLSFSGIVRALSELWPFLALAYAIAVASRRGGTWNGRGTKA